MCGDGCLEEGVSHEAASFAGHLGLGRLVYVYDDNHITIDGPTELSYTDDVPKRFAGYGWHVVELGEVANDLDAIEAGIREGMAEAERPSLVILRSHIGYPSPKYTDTAHAHGNRSAPTRSPRSRRSSASRRKTSSCPTTCSSTTAPPACAARARARSGSSGSPRSATRSPSSPKSSTRASSERGLAGLGVEAAVVGGRREAVATRVACKEVARRDRRRRARRSSRGGADLTGNTGTELDGAPVIATHEFGGRQIHWGIREHGMGSVMNGMAVSGLLPAGGTFFVFSDYMRRAVRLAALSQYKTAFVWIARLRRRRRGRPDPPADRAPRVAPGDARAATHPSGRRQRDRPGVAGAHRGRGPDRADPQPGRGSRCSPTRPSARAEGAAHGARTCSSTRPATTSTSCCIGTGSEVSVCVAACEQLVADGLLGAGRVDAVVGPLRRAGRRVLRRGAAARRAGARGGGGRDARLGALRRRRDRASIASARRHPALPCSTSSGSTPDATSLERVHRRAARRTESRHNG